MNGHTGGPAPAQDGGIGSEGRLWGLLQDLLAARGRKRTAELLGVSERTLRRVEAAGRLTGPLADALEQYATTAHHTSHANPDAAADVTGLGGRIERLEQGTAEALAELRAELAEAIAANEALQSRVAELEQGASGSPPAPSSGRLAGTPSTPSNPDSNQDIRLDRRYPELVTEEAVAGEERVYREAAPLVAQWRSERADYLAAGDGWRKLTAEWRMTELEIELIETHQLTLPPADFPWDGLRRHGELRRRRRTLERLRRERLRAGLKRCLLRLLTLGWRGR
ncbi:MAG: hypothetical protein OXD50_11345 [Chloroflexi bacterium]|nr:hypothetical protein [Chloroflexota bacterium]